MASKNLGNGTEPSTSPRPIKTIPKAPRMFLCDCSPGDREVPLPRAPFSFPLFSLPLLLLVAFASQFHMMPCLSCPGAAAKEGGRSQAPAPLPGGQRGAGPRRDLPTALPGPRPSFPPPASTPPGSATSDPFFSPCGAQQPGGLKRRGPSPASGAVAQLKAIKGLPSARAARAGPGPRLQARPRCPERAPSPQPPAFPGGSLSPKLLLGLRAERKRARAGHAQPHTSQPHASERLGPGTPACLQGVPPSTSC